MTAADRPGPDDLALLDELLASQELWIERAEEGRTLAERLLASTAPIVVLHGSPESGKTELIQRWVMPELSHNTRNWGVIYYSRADMARAAANSEGPVIEVWDDFERWLAAEEPLRASLLERLARSAASGGREGRIVLILQEDHLSSLFQLSSVVPRLLEDVGEIPAMSQTRLSRALADTVGPRGVHVASGFLEALVRDLEKARSVAGFSPELVAVLAFEFCQSHANHELTGDDYHALAGLDGILETHLDFVLERLPNSTDPQIGWAVLQEVAGTPAGQTVDLTDVSHRFDVAPEVPAQVLHWFTDRRHILRVDRDGGFSVVPGQFIAVAEARARRDADVAEPLRRLLRQGIQHFADGEALPPEPSFRKVHAHRSALKVTAEEAALMLRSALVYEDDVVPGATNYWLRRIKDQDVQVEILLDASFDSQLDVRLRAAGRLSGFPRPEVRNQLHLLALRDPNDTVRAEAVSSLAAMKDADLRVSLTREAQDVTSPYRLQAIDALRIFADADTVGVLVGIIRGNAPHHDQEARARAIDVLGCHDTESAADALLGIALDDEDPEDREGSARALGRTSSCTAPLRALSRLRDPGRVARKPRRPFSLVVTATGMAVVHILFAGVVFCLGVWVHGLLLATIGRIKLGIALALTQAVAAAVVFTNRSPWAWGVLVVTWSISVLAPTRILLTERLAGVTQSPYRRWLGGLLFAFDAATFFLAFHGLACMLARQMGRGLVLIGFEVLGVFLLVGFQVFFADTFVGFENVSGTIRLVPQLLTYLGISLFVLSYLIDVGSVLLTAFFWRDRREASHRVDHLYAELLRNEAASSAVLTAFRSRDRREAKWGNRIALRYRKVIQRSLLHLFSQADATTCGRVARVMARRPDADTVEFLRSATGNLGWRGRVQYVAALWRFRFSVWPKPLLILMGVAVFVLVAYTGVLYAYTKNSPESFLRTAQDAGKTRQQRTDAIDGLAKLSESPNRTVSSMAASSLRFALSDAASTETDDTSAVRHAVLTAILKLDRLSDREGMVQELLGQSGLPHETRKLAVDALQEIGTPAAAAKLKEFVERGAIPFRPGRPKPNDPDLDLRQQAITALGNLGGAGAEQLHLLQDLADNVQLPADLREAATALATVPETILASEALVEKGRSDDAIRQAGALIQSLPNTPSAQRGRVVLAKAYSGRGLLAFNLMRYPSADADLRKGVEVLTDRQINPADVSELFTLGLSLVFQYHETLALKSPKAFDDSYQLLLLLKAVSDRIPRSSDFNFGDLHANLAESSLTTGRYDEALRSAEQAIDSAKPQVKDAWASNAALYETTLNAKFIMTTAFVLKGDQAAAALARKDLVDFYALRPKDFINHWSYAGTRSYLDHAGLPAEQLKPLLEMMRVIQPG